MNRRLKSVLRAAGVVLGLGAVVVGVKWTGVAAIRKALSQVGGNIAWMFVAYAAGTAVAAVPWRRLLPDWLRPSWGATLASRFAASGVNALLPFFGVGEASRLLWLPRGHRSPVPAVPHSYLLAVLISAAVISVAVVGVGIGAARGKLVGKVRWALVMFGVPPTPGHKNNEVDPVDRGLTALLTGHRGPIAAAFGLHVGARLLLAAEIYAGLKILGVRVGVMGTLIFIAIPVGLSIIGTFVPGQIGLQEGASALGAAALGIGPATGIALVFLQRLRQLVFVPLAGLLLALLPYGPRPSDPPGTS
jgi:hypothetical protein